MIDGLVITVREKGKDIVAIFFDWRSYEEDHLSMFGVGEVTKFIRVVEKTSRDTDLRLACIHYCEENGGGIADSELKHAQSLFPHEHFEECIDTLEGAVYLSPEGMKYAHELTDFDIIVNMDTRFVENNALWSYLTWHAYNMWHSAHDNDFVPVTETNKHELTFITGIDIENFSFDRAETVNDLLTDAWNSYHPVIESRGRVYELI